VNIPEDATREDGLMGLDPHRPHRGSPADLAMVAGALLIVVALLLWAAVG
jgi:hypothetical protein